VEGLVEVLRGEFDIGEKDAVDRAKVKAAILARRKESHALNRDWESADRETWPTGPNRRD
jgi:hypothetical protein